MTHTEIARKVSRMLDNEDFLIGLVEEELDRGEFPSDDAFQEAVDTIVDEVQQTRRTERRVGEARVQHGSDR